MTDEAGQSETAPGALRPGSAGAPAADAPYIVHRTGPEPAWDRAPRSPRLVDMVTGAPGLFDTHRPESWTRVVFSAEPPGPIGEG